MYAWLVGDLDYYPAGGGAGGAAALGRAALDLVTAVLATNATARPAR